jgi:hypothetical protein
MKTVTFDQKRAEKIAEANGIEEKKEYTIEDKVLYMSKSSVAKLAFLKWDYDLIPETDDGKRNKDCEIMFTHSLPKPFKGTFKVKGITPLVRYIATRDNPEIGIKKGQQHAYYDKFLQKTDIFFQLEKEYKKLQDPQYRKSVEVYIPCRVFEIDKGDGTGVQKIDKDLLVSFNMIDVFYPDKIGFYKLLESYYLEDNMLESHKFKLSSTNLSPIKELSKDERKSVDESRKNVDKFLEEKSYLFPAEYDVLLEAIQNGEYNLVKPDGFDINSLDEKTSASPTKGIQNVSQDKYNKLVKEQFPEQDSELPPF